MGMIPRLELRQQQRMALTPGLRTRLAILRLSPAELDEALAAEAARNPFLRHERRQQRGPVAAMAEDGLTAHKAPFQDDLRRQILRMGLDKVIEALALFLVTELRADGFLDVGLDELAAERGLDPVQLAQGLEALQRCEPAGIGARSLRECLRLQMLDQGLSRDEAQAILDLLPQFARMEWKRIGAALGLDAEGVRARATLLRGLAPRPIAESDTAQAVPLVPDLVLRRVAVDDSLRIEPVEGAGGRVLLDRAMVHKAETEGFAPELLARARALVAALEQRGRTLARIGEWLVRRQADFFRIGPAGLRPATQLDLAGDLGLHPSTISRALAGKAIDVDGRLWPLSVFFASSLPGEAGAVSSRVVQRRIAELIAAEPEGKPLSDESLAQMLREQGVDIARRTVAKYRQGLRIPPSSTRRRLAATRRGE